jgi:hypothetical protein
VAVTPHRLLQLVIVLVVIGHQVWFLQRLDASPDPRLPSSQRAAPVVDEDGGLYQLTADNGSIDNAADNDTDDNSTSDNGTSDNDSGNDNGDRPTIVVIRPEAVAPSVALPQITQPTATCSTPGHDSTVVSVDGRATVRIFANMPESVRVDVRPFYDLLALPPLPGRLAGLLVYDVTAERCRGGALASFPAEVNLNVQYADEDVDLLNEATFMYSYLDPELGVWRPVEKQYVDTRRNAIGATITRTGRYIVYEDP